MMIKIIRNTCFYHKVNQYQPQAELRIYRDKYPKHVPSSKMKFEKLQWIVGLAYNSVPNYEIITIIYHY